MQQSVVVVVPAYNEAQRVATVVRSLVALSQVNKVVVVNDGSEDDTVTQARAAGATVLNHKINRGQGAALVTGMRYALQCGAAIVVHFDADEQHDAKDIAALLDPIQKGGVEVVLGSRFLGNAPGLPLQRRIILKFGIVFTWLYTGLWLTDTNNGLRAFSRKAVETMQLTQDGMAHASEIIDEIATRGLRFAEVPVTVHYTKASLTKGQSSSNAVNIVWRLFIDKFF